MALGRQRVELGDERDVALDPRLVQPLLADRPHAVVRQPGQVGVQDEAEGARDRGAVAVVVAAVGVGGHEGDDGTTRGGAGRCPGGDRGRGGRRFDVPAVTPSALGTEATDG